MRAALRELAPAIIGALIIAATLAASLATLAGA